MLDAMVGSKLAIFRDHRKDSDEKYSTDFSNSHFEILASLFNKDVYVLVMSQTGNCEISDDPNTFSKEADCQCENASK